MLGVLANLFTQEYVWLKFGMYKNPVNKGDNFFLTKQIEIKIDT